MFSLIGFDRFEARRKRGGGTHTKKSWQGKTVSAWQKDSSATEVGGGLIIGELEQELLFILTLAYLFTLIKGNARFWNKDFKY